MASLGTALGATRGTTLGPVVPAAALALSTLAGCAPLTPLGVFEWEEFESRGTTAPMPAAPPPAQGDHILDLSVRELGATRTSGSEVSAHAGAGMHPLRTDGALSVRLADMIAVRALGALGYGAPLGAAPAVGFPTRPSASGGLGVVFGWWRDRAWSIALEVDVTVVLLSNRDRYAVVTGPCFWSPPLFALFGRGDGVSCVRERATGDLTMYEGTFLAATPTGTLDVAGWPVSWLRVGGGASVADSVSRGTDGSVMHEAVGIARVFVEARLDDVWLGVEAQQWVVENVTFAPALALTFGGVAFERARRVASETADSDADPPRGSVPPALGWDGHPDTRDAAAAEPRAAPRRRPQRVPTSPTSPTSPASPAGESAP